MSRADKGEMVTISECIIVFQDPLTDRQLTSIENDPLVKIRKIERGYIVMFGIDDFDWVDRHNVEITIAHPPTELEIETLGSIGQSVH